MRLAHSMIRLTALVLAVSCLIPGISRGDDAVSLSVGVLRTADGGAIPGRFAGSTTSGFVRWQGESFVEPFEFPQEQLASVEFPSQRPQERPPGSMALELVGGDLLSGEILDWSDEVLTLESPHFGPLHVQTSAVRRIYRLQDNPLLLFPGLSGLTDEWHQPVGKWKAEGVQIRSADPGSILGGQLPFPDQVMIEVELSWATLPNFTLALGVDPKSKKDRRQDGFRLETWGSTLAIVRENQEIADVAAAVKLDQNARQVHFVCYLDQSAGEMHVHDAQGMPLARIKVPPTDPFQVRRENQGLRFVLRQGEMQIERLRVARWDGILPGTLEPGMMRLRMAEGPARTGQIIGLDRASRLWRTSINGEELEFPLEALAMVDLHPTFEELPGGAAAVLQDSTRIRGTIEGVAGEEISFRCPAIQELITLPITRLKALAMSQLPMPAENTPVPLHGRLVIGDHETRGKLNPGAGTDLVSTFVWQPRGSRVGSPLRPEIGAEIIYREARPAPATVAPQGRQVNQQPGANFFNLFLQEQTLPKRRILPKSAGEMSLHLRSGDVIPCRITEITEEGVHIESSVVETKFIPHGKVKALELVKSETPPDLKAAKKQRLLTVPRIMKSSPPTQLLCSRNQDFLRCRLLSLGEGTLRVELQLEELQIPVDRVSQIIWFHPDEGDTTAFATKPTAKSEDLPQPSESKGSTSGALAQVIKPNGDRVTFTPVSLVDDALLGESDVLGNVRFELSQIDRILIGDRIAKEAANLPYHQWVLTPAKEPLVAQQGDEGSAADLGTLSPLVGQPAPDFQLDLLDGKSFRLSSHKGKIIVLDFWASWCGPCMQTMPLVEAAMEEFDSAKVQLVSVNLEEPKARIQAALDRLGLPLTVAMDIDGTIARKYQANAIPQLVVVDAQGNVARLYIGGGSSVVLQLQQALRELTQ